MTIPDYRGLKFYKLNSTKPEYEVVSIGEPFKLKTLGSNYRVISGEYTLQEIIKFEYKILFPQRFVVKNKEYEDLLV